MIERYHKTTIVFDFDGTLIDSMSGFGNLAAKVMVEIYGCGFQWALENYRATSGLPFYYQLEKLFPSDRRNYFAHERFMLEKMLFYKNCPFYDDSLSTLKSLKKMGYLIIISSNNEETILFEKVKELQFSFDLVLGFREGFLKGRSHFHQIQQVMKLHPSNIIFVGDSLHDAAMAHENSIDFIARIGTFSEKDFSDQGIAIDTISKLSELASLLSTFSSSVQKIRYNISNLPLNC